MTEDGIEGLFHHRRPHHRRRHRQLGATSTKLRSAQRPRRSTSSPGARAARATPTPATRCPTRSTSTGTRPARPPTAAPSPSAEAEASRPTTAAIYFLSPELLDGSSEPEDGSADQPNLYLHRPGSSPQFVATLESSATGPAELLEEHKFKKFFGAAPDPEFVAVDNSGGPSDGDVYVADGNPTADGEGQVIRKYDPEGNLITSWKNNGVIRIRNCPTSSRASPSAPAEPCGWRSTRNSTRAATSTNTTKTATCSSRATSMAPRRRSASRSTTRTGSSTRAITTSSAGKKAARSRSLPTERK